MESEHYLQRPIQADLELKMVFLAGPRQLGKTTLALNILARLENLVGQHLLKLCHLLQDRDGHDAELFYLRDRTGRELDFLVTLKRKPWFAVEVKSAETQIDPALRYFKERLEIPWVYQAVGQGVRDFVEQGVRCLPAWKLMAALA